MVTHQRRYLQICFLFSFLAAMLWRHFSGAGTGGDNFQYLKQIKEIFRNYDVSLSGTMQQIWEDQGKQNIIYNKYTEYRVAPPPPQKKEENQQNSLT